MIATTPKRVPHAAWVAHFVAPVLAYRVRRYCEVRMGVDVRVMFAVNENIRMSRMPALVAKRWRFLAMMRAWRVSVHGPGLSTPEIISVCMNRPKSVVSHSVVLDACRRVGPVEPWCMEYPHWWPRRGYRWKYYHLRAGRLDCEAESERHRAVCAGRKMPLWERLMVSEEAVRAAMEGQS
jgi:hypothetical protein